MAIGDRVYRAECKFKELCRSHVLLEQLESRSMQDWI
jgi:hypothetical protein